MHLYIFIRVAEIAFTTGAYRVIYIYIFMYIHDTVSQETGKEGWARRVVESSGQQYRAANEIQRQPGSLFEKLMGKGERKGFNSYGHLKFLVNFVISSNLPRYDFHRLVIKTAKNGLVFHPFVLSLLLFTFAEVFCFLFLSFSHFRIFRLILSLKSDRMPSARSIYLCERPLLLFFFSILISTAHGCCVCVYVY